MNIINTKTGFTLAAVTLTNQIMVTIVTSLASTGVRTILTTFKTNEEIIYDFLKDGLYELHQVPISTVVSPTGYYISGGNIYFNTVLVSDISTLLDNVALTKDSLKVIIVSDMENCYSTLLRKILDSKLSSTTTTTRNEEEIKDLLQMSLAVIKYSAELGLVYQALHIIESITSSCNICNTNVNLNCGCNA